jgi:prepilin peptidase CpaA
MALFALFLVAVMLVVLWLDVTRYTIPNWLNAVLLIAYPLAVWRAPVAVDWPMALAGAAIVFAAGYVVFSRGWMGGGDIKLITVCALWVGWQHLLDFIFIFALLGGALSLLVWGVRKLLPHVTSRPLPRILQNGAPVPYGVAIALGFLLMLWMGRIPAVILP